jgi:hypothetical protein
MTNTNGCAAHARTRQASTNVSTHLYNIASHLIVSLISFKVDKLKLTL